MISGVISFSCTTPKPEEVIRVVVNIDEKSVFTDFNGIKTYVLTVEEARQLRKTITKQLRLLK